MDGNTKQPRRDTTTEREGEGERGRPVQGAAKKPEACLKSLSSGNGIHILK